MKMTGRVLQASDAAVADELYMSFELGDKSWKLTVSDGRRGPSRYNVEAGDEDAVAHCVGKARDRLKLEPRAKVHSCYEAGRDGWWLHRWLIEHGIDNIVVDSASIEVCRRARRAKTDRLDGDKLLAMLLRHHAGERVWSVLHEPSPEDEDARRTHRELARLTQERTAHTNRIGSLLVLVGRHRSFRLRRHPDLRVFGSGTGPAVSAFEPEAGDEQARSGGSDDDQDDMSKGVGASEVARLLGVTEGAVRYHARRMRESAVDGRSAQMMKAETVAVAIAHWREQQGEGPVNLAALHEWLEREHGYQGSLRSVQRFWNRTYPAPPIRARRRVETPAAAQTQVDWAAFPGVVVDGERADLLSLHMVLSHSRREAVVWSRRKDILSWLHCHGEGFRRLGGVTATVRVDNEKTAVSRGAGAWGTINATYRRYALILGFHVDACAPRQPQAKGKVERQVRSQRLGADPSRQCWRDLEELQAWSDEQAERCARRRRCPITGETVWDTWQVERRLLTPLPENLPEPFDLALTRSVGIDGLVSFEGRQYRVPFAYVGRRVEVRGCANNVQILADNAIVAVHPRHGRERLVIDPSHYDGPSTPRVQAPTPLGRLGQRLQALAQLPVAHRAIDLYAQLAEVAR